MVTLWHLTENPKWKLDLKYHPLRAYGLPQPSKEPGIFVTDLPVYWNPYFGRGPIWAVRIETPEEILPKPSGEHPEYFIRDLSQVKVVEILPLSEAIEKGQEEERRGIPWWRQEYGGFGGVSDWWFSYDEQRGLKVKRKGLEKLMKDWREKHPGYKDPDAYFRARFR